jgi:hypothetical protein
MPEPNRAHYRIATQLKGLRMGEIAAAGRDLTVICDACPNFRIWRPHELRRVFVKLSNTRIEDVAERLRCRQCGSSWLRIGFAN